MELSVACAAAENFVFQFYEGDMFHEHSVHI